MASIMANTSQTRQPAASNGQQDPFLTPGPFNAAKFADLDNESPTAYTNDSPMHAKRVLEAHIADLDRRIKQASTLGTSLVDHRKELSKQLTEVESHKDAEDMGPELKRKLLDLEREYNDLGKDTARSFIPRSRYVSNEAGASPSPAKMQVPAPMRKQRPQSVDNFGDVEFAANLSTQLVQEVRDLQTQLRTKDEQIRESNNQMIRLQGEVEGFHQRLRSVDDDEEKFKDVNWNLETRLQELEAQLRETQLSEERLKKTLNSTKAEKSAVDREFEELKATHYQLTDDHVGVQKQHETDVSGLRRTVDAREREQELMQRKIDELTSQNQELAKAVAWRVRSDTESGAEEYESAPQPEDRDRSSPDGSPPGSPSKATPARHGVLEHETMRSSLAHLQKRYQSLQNNIHREKTEKIELRRLLQDARDELERRDKDPGLGSIKRPKSSTTAAFKKPANPNKLGGAKSASEEVWEDFEDNPLRRSVIHHRSQPSTDASDAYDTANEGATDAYATANEKDTTTDSDAFATGVESMANSSDELTETEDGPSGKQVKRMPSTASNLRRHSFLSTASASDDDNDAYDVTTPTSNTQRYRASRLGRSGTYRASPSMRDSPASFVSNTSGPTSNMNLAAELEDFDTSSTAASTPSRSIASSNASPRLDDAPPIPPMPSSLFRSETKDSGTLTDTHGSPKSGQGEFASKTSAALGGGVIGGIAGALFGSNTPKKAEEKDHSQAASKELSESQIQGSSTSGVPYPSQAELDEMIEQRVKARIAEIEAAKPAPEPVFPPSPKINVDQLVDERVAKQVEAFKASQPKSLSQAEIDALVSARATVLAEQAKPKQHEIDALVENRAKELAEQAKPKQHEIDALVATKAAQLAEQQKPQQHEIDALVATQAAQLAEQQRPQQHEIDALVETRAQQLAQASQPKQADIDALVASKAQQLAEQSRPKQAEIDALVAAKAQQLAEQSRPKQAEIDAMVESRAKALAASQPPPAPKGPSQAEIDALVENRANELAASRTPPPPRPLLQAEIDALVEDRARVLAAEMAAEDKATRGPEEAESQSKATPTHVAFSQLLSKSYSRDGTPVSRTSMGDSDRASSPEEDTAGNRNLRSALRREVHSVEDPFNETPVSSARSSALSEGPSQAHYSLTSSIGRDSRHPISLTASDFTSKSSTATIPSLPRETADEGTQTTVSSEQIDSLIKERNKRADTVAPSSPRTASHRNTPNVAKLPEGIFIRRPGSQSSIRTTETTKQVPPLPADHREAIAAATSRNSSMVSNSHPVPPIPKPNPLRPRTPSYSQNSATRGSTRRRDVSAIRIGQDPSRRSSISSFASEVDGRFDMHRPVYPDAYGDGADPRMIAAITQTMIGEFMWKYTRKAGRADHSENRHRRFFWIHPYTRTLYWSTQDPSHAGKDELKAKSVAIEAVRVVGDDNPLPPGLHTKSLIIVTPGRSIKLTASTSGRHETWFNALSYLLLRGNEQPNESVYSNVQRDRSSTVNSHQSDVAEFDPYARPSSSMTHRSNQSLAARYASAPQPRLTKTPSTSRRAPTQQYAPSITPSVSGHSTGTTTPVRGDDMRAGEFGEFKKPRPPSYAVGAPEKKGVSSRLSNLSLTNLTRRGRAQSRAADERRRQEEQQAMPSPQSAEFAHQHHHHHHGHGQGGNVENVRACCDGRSSTFSSSSSYPSLSSLSCFGAAAPEAGPAPSLSTTFISPFSLSARHFVANTDAEIP